MVSQRIIERLIIYKYFLNSLDDDNINHVFSHQLADLTSFTAAQVRRDLMNIGYSGNQKNGYDVKKLIQYITEFINPSECIKLVLIGVGNLGRAILHYFSELRPRYVISACFDTDVSKVGEFFYYSKCFNINDMPGIIRQQEIKGAIITVPPEYAQEAADELIECGIKSIINFAPVKIKVPGNVFVEHIDFSAAVEKLSYFMHKLRS